MPSARGTFLNAPLGLRLGLPGCCPTRLQGNVRLGLAAFRRWAISHDFPTAGPIDWFASHIEVGRVRLVPAAGGKPDRFVELEGGPDLIVEIASDSSVGKDTQRLPAACHAAGVREFWIVDARRDEVLFTILKSESSGYVADVSANGTPRSKLFDCLFSLVRSRNAAGRFVYDLVV